MVYCYHFKPKHLLYDKNCFVCENVLNNVIIHY